MSKKFKKTLQEKYGADGAKGKEGENFFRAFYEAKGYDVVDNNEDILLQAAGVDFYIKVDDNIYTVDVKNNLTIHDEVVVEIQPDGWLFNPKKKSMFISHVDAINGKIVTYKRSKMQKFIIDNYWDYRDKFIYLPFYFLPFTKVEFGNGDIIRDGKLSSTAHPKVHCNRPRG